MSKFDPGKLRHRVSLQSLEHEMDSSGIQTETWSEVAQVWAAIEPLSGREYIAAQAQQSAVSARITIAWRSGVTAGMRIVHGLNKYDIQGVLPDQDSGVEYLTLPVSQGVGEGQ